MKIAILMKKKHLISMKLRHVILFVYVKKKKNKKKKKHEKEKEKN